VPDTEARDREGEDLGLAGFDAVFRFRANDRPVLDACLSASRRRARLFHVRFASQVRGEEAYVRFDGQTYALDIYLELLRRDLPTIGEATPATRGPEGRRRLALGLIDIVNRYRGGLYERYPDEWLPTLRAH
jgi:hypothetical protein